MNLKFLFLVLFVSFFSGITGQVQSEDCSNIPFAAAAQFTYPAENGFQSCNMQIKLYYHLYYDSAGNNGVPNDRPEKMTDLLNGFFTGTGISFFYNECEVRRINDDDEATSIDNCTTFYQSTAPSDGINIHVKDDSNAFRGVASGIPGNELLLSGSWSSPSTPLSLSQTFPHEMGHCLGLFHTHQSMCSTGFAGCDGVVVDPTGSPANNDYVDDTPRDPNLVGTVNTSCVWSGTINCDDGMGAFTPLTDNFMAYTRFTCRTNFTAGQITRMCALTLPEVIHSSEFACCNIEEEAPSVSGDFMTNECPDEFVDLDDIFTGSIPDNTVLVWSQDDNDPTDGLIHVPNSIATSSGIYFAYFYNVENDCYSLASIAVEVKIQDCCTDPIPDYIIVDENGNPKTDFCVGDDVFINACGSIDATSYFLGIFEYEIGGFAAGESHVGYSRLDPSWSGTAPGCMISLDDVWANFKNYEFRADHEYQIQFAVDNECTSSWHVKDDGVFTMSFPTPDYHYVDANGIPKDVFCIGETVFLDGSASTGENRYFLSIWQFNIGGLAAGESHLAYSRLNPSWTNQEVGSLINLNEIWANFQGDFFDPGFEYRVQLAVRGECSNGWNVKEDKVFTVICCDGPSICDADFTVSTEEDKDGNIIFNFNNTDEIYFDHSWTVLQHTTQGSGPYTEVASSTSADFQFTGELGGCYTIVHTVDTPCGSCCYSREICNDSSESPKKGLSSSSVVDCDILCNLLPPEGLGCSVDETGYLVLQWDEVSGANSYEVELNFNDPDCCGNKEGKVRMKGHRIETETNSVRLQIFPICMSWTVTAVCDNGHGPTSEKVCFNQQTGCGNGLPQIQNQTETRQSSSARSSIEVYPNPASDVIQCSVSLEEGDKVRNMNLVDMNGRVIDGIDFTSTNESQVTGRYDVKGALSGIYFVRVQLDTQVLMKKIIIVR